MKSMSRNTTSKPLAKDPVCGMTVDPRKATDSFYYNGQIYYFCSTSCLEKFRADLERFLNARVTQKEIQRTPPKASKVEYTCPMHPQIVRDAPGNCPVCGMALEPRTVSLTEEGNPELVDMRQRLWVSTALSIPLLVLAMSEFLYGDPLRNFIGMRNSIWISLVLAS